MVTLLLRDVAGSNGADADAAIAACGAGGMAMPPGLMPTTPTDHGGAVELLVAPAP